MELQLGRGDGDQKFRDFNHSTMIQFMKLIFKKNNQKLKNLKFANFLKFEFEFVFVCETPKFEVCKF